MLFDVLYRIVIVIWRYLMKIRWDILLPLLIALAGWFVVNWLSSQRDQENKRRELYVQYLLEAYQNLMDAACYEKFDGSEKTFRLVAKASANIQLFGNDKQIQMDQKVTDEYAKGKTVSLTELLEDIRSDLRKELKLSATEQKLHWLKIEKKNQNKVPVNSETIQGN